MKGVGCFTRTVLFAVLVAMVALVVAMPALANANEGEDLQAGILTGSQNRGPSDEELPSGDVSGSSGWIWKLVEDSGNEGEYTLTFEYTGSADPAPALKVPASFAANAGLGDYASSITKLVVPEGGTELGNSAFASLSGLKSATLPSTLAGQNGLGTNVFQNCTSLTSVNLEDTKITHVGADAFAGCASLTSVKLPSTTTNINARAFQGCSSLSNADFSEAENLAAIRDNAFNGCDLRDVNIPDSKITSIGKYVFANNSNLKTVSMPALRYFNSAPSSETYLFADCPSLEEVTFRTANKTSYTNNSSLPNYAFQNDTALKKLDLTGWSNWNTTLTIGNSFNSSSLANLEELILPTSTNVTIGSQAFQGKTGLSSLHVFKNPESVKSIQANAFNGSGITEADLTNWTGITAINEGVFANCQNLTSVTIPAQVTTLGKQAFKNDQQLASFRVNSTKLTSVAKDVFDGTGRLDTITIGKGVEQITANFFVATPAETNVLFEGESIIKATKATLSGGESPLKDLNGTYWVSPEGVLYELNDDGTASLAYIPDGITSYTVPATITTATDAGVEGATYTVDRMNSHAVHQADSLTSLTFAAPSQVTIAPNAFTGRSTSDDANGLTVNGDTKIDPNDFASVSVLCDYPLTEESGMQLVPAIESTITDIGGNQIAKTTIAVNDKDISDDGIYHYNTGEKATYTIAISNSDNKAMQNVVRVYFDYSAAGQNMGSFPVRDDPYNLINPGTGSSYPCKVVETETPGIYYYEITGILPGETLAFQNDVFYPSPSTAGGTLRIWTDTLTSEQAETQAGKLIDPTDYIELDWSTSPVKRKLTKERSPQSLTDSRAATIQVNQAGEARVANLAYRFYESNEESHSTTEGLDFIRWVQYDDIIDLPEELSWRPEVIQAINAGMSDSSAEGDGWWIYNTSTTVDSRDYTGSREARLVQLRASGKTYDLAYVAFSDGTGRSYILGLTPSIVTVDGEQKLKLSWYVNNSTLDS